MQRIAPQRPAASPGGVLLLAGAGGGVLAALSAVAMYRRPGVAAGVATVAAELLCLLGFVGLDRRGRHGAGWRRVAAFMAMNAVAALASLGLPRIGIGAVVDLFGSLSWLTDAAAYGVLGAVLLPRRSNVHRRLGVVAGAASALRAGAALMLACLQPLEAALVLPELFLLHLWQLTAACAGVAMAGFFIVARSMPRP